MDPERPPRPQDNALLVVDVLDTFDHDDGDVLLRRFADRAPFMEHAIGRARRRGWHVVYVNDDHGSRSADDLVARARAGPGGRLVERLGPHPGDPVVLKRSRSGFDDTDLARVLRSLGVHRLVVLGAVTEICVAATAEDAVREGWETIVLRGASVPLASARERDGLEALRRAGVAVVAAPDGAATA